ncbi:MAG: non-ribosomal peptide synthetase [Actinomycetota bacterium]
MSQTDDLIARRSGLSADRLTLLERLKRGRGGTAVGIPKRQTEGPAELSFSQERLWLLDQLLGPGNAYNTIPLAARVHGSIVVDILERSIAELVQRHETLRTTFTTIDGQPRQVVAATMPVTVDVVDLRDVPDPEGEALRRITDGGRRPFVMTSGRPFAITLLMLADEEHFLFLLTHHMISDGWSDDVFMRELAAIYLALATGAPAGLPPLPIQYADYAAWQREWLRDEVLEGLLSYWRTQLDGAPAGLDLAFDHPRPPVPRFVSSTLWADIPPDVTSGLKALAQTERVTLFMTALAAVDVLLSRYSGQTDMVVGSPIAGRTRVETEGLIGCFINTLVLRTDLGGNPTFRELIARVRDTALGAYAHQDLPFERLVDDIRPDRDSTGNPFFQVMFVLQNSPDTELEFGDIRLRPIVVDNGVARFDLTIELREYEGQLRGRFQFDSDLFEPATCARLVEHFQTLLAGIAANPDLRISDLALLSDAERDRIVDEWNDTARPRELVCIHHAVEAQVARAPEAVGVSAPDGSLTYRELDVAANRLARKLRALGVGPDTLVALCVERSLALPVGILGILKAGGAYVPLDPTFPRNRLAYMLSDSRAPVLVTQLGLVDDLPAHDAQTVFVDAPDAPDADEGDEAAPQVPGLTPEHLAYVLYTSGSTGRPKGVMIPHRAVTNLARSVIEESTADSTDVVLQYATFCFDVSVLEIFTALCSGARLVIPSSETALIPAALTELMQRERVTIADIPPAVLELLPADGFPSLRFQLIGGEAFSGALATRWQAAGRRAFNGYGPTEATVTMTLMELRGPYDQLPPIGFPMPNHQVYVLDQWMQPLPIGVVGELYLGGVGLARGYLHRPDLTAERFVPNPFGEPGSRLYRTGDLARFLDTGALEFLGRIDGQVKIRGHRIELGEIEAVTAGFPGVQQVAVTVREAPSGAKQLVAYVVPEPSTSLAPSEIRSWLRERLPGYMVPHAVVLLDSFALLPSGKVDRSALPDPAEHESGPEEASVVPRTELEAVLAGAFARVLGLERLGVHDSFFDAGGNSLQLAELQAQLLEALDIEVPLRALFQLPSVAELAEHLATIADVTRASGGLDDREEGEL